MATNFPTSLDNLTNPTGSSSLTSPDHAGQHTDANDAIEALQAKVGVNGSAVTTSLDYKISSINSSIALLNQKIVPTATIVQYAGTTAPSGNWLICDGSAVSRSTYIDLFLIVGTTYGAGNGSTTFNLPDLRTRVPVGKNSSGTFANLGGTGGAETVTLSTTEMPSHTHTQNAHNHGITDPGHSHTFAFTSGPGGGTVGYLISGVVPSYPNTNSATTGITINNTTATNQNAGGGGAHNNLQPYIVLNYLIKT